MYLLLLALVGSAVGIPSTLTENLSPARTDARSARYGLPTQTFPTFYDVTLYLDPNNATNFQGNVAINILSWINTREIVLHAMDMDISSIRVFRDTLPNVNLYESHVLANDDTHFLRILVSQDIPTIVPHTVVIEYIGRPADDMFGIYVSSYEPPSGGRTNLITSQLQPTFARRAFPCYDEPAVKAVFRITIYAPPAFPVVKSNMPERTFALKPAVPGYTKFEFEDTLVMSTYLLAFLVSDFESINNALSPQYHIPMRIYSRPGTQEFATFALDFGERNMDALEQYIDFVYAFPKMDKAAIPDFGAGAMENWGLVLYREVALLVQDGVTSTSTKQNIGRIICHENVHQWFGNEVSPQSWTYTWLNEGFANFFENFGTDLVLPEWRMMDQFVIMLQNVFQNDAVLSVNPMTHAVYNPSEIIGTFNAVAYQKSGSVIRMMQHALTPEVFRRGLIYFIRDNARRAATPESLFTALQQAVNESNRTVPWSVAATMIRWTTQGGFPVVTVRRTAPNSESVYVAQERYLTDTSLTSTDRWIIPINWVLSTNADFSDTSPQAWIGPNQPGPAIDIPGLSSADWIIVNKQQTGYYRVNYDVENWQALVDVLNSSHSTINVLNRGQLIDDAFNLARTGRLNYHIALDLSRYLVQESDYIPWASANAAFNYLDSVLGGSDAYGLFQNYTLELMAPLYSQLGFVAGNEEHVTAFHRNIILDHNCRQGNQDCLDQARLLLQQFIANPTQRLNPDIQTIVYCSGLRGGDVNNFNFLWQQYLASTDSSEQSILMNALGCTSDADRRDFFLRQVIEDTSPVREQDRHSIIVSVINSGSENREAALDFIIDNFHLIQTRVQGLSGTSNILIALARTLNTEDHSRKIDDFVDRHGAIFSASEVAGVNAIRENIAASIAWNDEHLSVVDAWLRDYYGNGSKVITSGVLVLFSIVIAILNL